jgi:hypothetical protein
MLVEMETTMKDRLISVSEFKSRFCVSHTKFYREVAAGRIRIRKMGRSTRISEADAKMWFDGLPVRSGGDAR